MRNVRRKSSFVLAGLTALSVACSAADGGEDVASAESSMSGNWGATHRTDAGPQSDAVPPALASCSDRDQACHDYIVGSAIAGVILGACAYACASGSMHSCTVCALGAACTGLDATTKRGCTSDTQEKVKKHFANASKCWDFSGDCQPQYVCLVPTMQPSVACNDDEDVVAAECKRQTQRMQTCGDIKKPCVPNPNGPSPFTDYECSMFYLHCTQNTAVFCATPEPPTTPSSADAGPAAISDAGRD